MKPASLRILAQSFSLGIMGAIYFYSVWVCFTILPPPGNIQIITCTLCFASASPNKACSVFSKPAYIFKDILHISNMDMYRAFIFHIRQDNKACSVHLALCLGAHSVSVHLELLCSLSWLQSVPVCGFTVTYLTCPPLMDIQVVLHLLLL